MRVQNRSRVTDPFPAVQFRVALTLAAALAVVSVEHVGQAATTGRIAGVVHVSTRSGAPLRPGAYPSRRVTKAAGEASEISNVVVFIADAPRDAAPPAMRASISQRDESFVPRVVAVTRNSTVEFPNFDPFFHDVFSLSRNATFDLGRYPKGQTRERRFTQPGIVKVFCNIHSDMSAIVMVFDHRYFAVPTADGTFEIDSVPAGTWRVNAWHERIGSTSSSLQVVAGGTARVEFTVPVVDER